MRRHPKAVATTRMGWRMGGLLLLVPMGAAVAGCAASDRSNTVEPANKVVSETRPSTFDVADVACGVLQEGSSFVVAPETVVTNAHVVAGAKKVDLQDNNVLRPASVVLYDPTLDVAVLRVPGLTAPVLPVHTGKVTKGESVVIVAYPSGSSEVTSQAQVTSTFQAVGLDIYGQKRVTRSVYQLHVDGSVDPGEGGGPVVATGSSDVPGRNVLALIFARSTTTLDTGFALAMGPVMADVVKAKDVTTPVSTGACLSPASNPVPAQVVPGTVVIEPPTSQ